MKLGGKVTISKDHNAIIEKFRKKFSDPPLHSFKTKPETTTNQQKPSIIQKPSRFPFEVFSAGTLNHKRSVAVLPEERTPKVPFGHGSPRKLCKKASLPDFLGPTSTFSSVIEQDMLFDENISNIKQTKYDIEGFLPSIGKTDASNKRNIVNLRPGIFSERKGTHVKRKSMPELNEEEHKQKLRQTPVPLVTSMMDMQIFKTQEKPEHIRKASWSECQAANLDLLLNQTKSIVKNQPEDKLIIGESKNLRLPLPNLEELNLPLTNMDKVWKTLHKKLKPIPSQVRVPIVLNPHRLPQKAKTSEESMRQTGCFGKAPDPGFHSPASKMKMVYQRKYETQRNSTKPSEEVKTVNVTFGDNEEKE